MPAMPRTNLEQSPNSGNRIDKTPAVRVCSVSKKYSLHPESHKAYTLKDLIGELVGRRANSTIRKDEFLAVDDVTFEVLPGDTLGLIGRNGAGKTTLLKMLAGITKLDKGTIIVEGRVQALINLGAGFNAKLSGRDNVKNLAALSGFGARETREIFDDVVAFAELERFIDSPVETYSAGMKARLGFSVAVHLHPEILLIDEILSVGDFAFKNKCFIRMQELKRSGVTIVFVSHSHTHVMQLCDKALWIHEGKLVQLGPARETVQNYLDFVNDSERTVQQAVDGARKELARNLGASGGSQREGLFGPVCHEKESIESPSVRILSNGIDADVIRVHDEITVEYTIQLKREVKDLNVTLSFFRKDGVRLCSLSTLNGDVLREIRSGGVTCRVRIPDFNFNPGAYVLVMPVHEGKSYLFRDVVKEFHVKGNGHLTWDFVDLTHDYEVNQSPSTGIDTEEASTDGSSI